jgi:hypothetical protein
LQSACIDHKFLRKPWDWINVSDQFRLWQRNPRLAPAIPLLSGEKSLKTVCYHLFIFKAALKWTRSVCPRAFLTRNMRAASPNVWIFAG